MWRLSLLLLVQYSIAFNYDYYSRLRYCARAKKPTDNMEYKLISDMKSCGFSVFKPPYTNDTSPIKVNLHFYMKSFKYDSQLQEFSANMWTIISWYDYRMKWDPKKYSGIDSFSTTTADIWAPTIKFFNRVEDSWDQRYWYVPCDVYSDGKVACVERAPYSAKCASDLRDWPYDAQTCKLEFGHFHETGTKLQLVVASRAVSMLAASYGAEWDITDYQQKLNTKTEKQLSMAFKIERHGDPLAAIVIYPSIILTAMTFFAQFLDARFYLRLLILSFSLMNHFDFLSELSYHIPDNTCDPPRLLMYYRGSFILTSIVIVQSIVLNIMCKRDVACPDWINSINDFVYIKLPKFVVWPRWDSKVDEIVSASSFIRDWTDFANIINSLTIVVSMIVYVSLYYVFIPQPIPFNL